jgi:hypothetical protein
LHGAAVASIAVGQTVGVAPEADLYYIAAPSVDWIDEINYIYNFHHKAQAIRRILEINEQLPENRKIRVISISVGWNQEQTGYEDIMAACDEAKAAGMLIVSSSIERVHGFRLQGLGRYPLADPDIFESYEPGIFWAQDFYDYWRWSTINKDLLVPMDSRTTASPCGEDDYVWYSIGGISWAIPYVAGVYALAAQVAPEITPDEFWSLAMETGLFITLVLDNGNVAFGPIVDPAALIDSLSSPPAAQSDNN